MLDEHNLRKRITELQEYRRNGVTTALEAEAYETAKNARVSRAVNYYRDWANLHRLDIDHLFHVPMYCPQERE